MEDHDVSIVSYGSRPTRGFFDQLVHHLNLLHSEVSALEQLGEAGEALVDRHSGSASVEVSPWPIRASIVVMLIATLEGTLFNLCQRTQETQKLQLSVTDLDGRSNLRRIQLFFKKVAGLRFPDQTPCWPELKRLYKLRNALVHRWGKVEGQGAEEIAQIAGAQVHEGEVWLESSAVEGAFRTVREFAEELRGHLGGEQNGERDGGSV